MKTIKLTDHAGKVRYYHDENSCITIEARVSPSWYEEVSVHLLKRQKVLAIRAHRDANGGSLHESKAIVDQLEDALVSIEEKYVQMVKKTIKLEDLL